MRKIHEYQECEKQRRPHFESSLCDFWRCLFQRQNNHLKKSALLKPDRFQNFFSFERI